jgi:Peptidase family M28/Fibronectin type III domain
MKRAILRVAVALAVGLIPAGVHARGDEARGDEPKRDGKLRIDREIAEAIEDVDSERIQDSVQRLEAFGSRQSCSAPVAPSGKGVSAARDWILKQFSKIDGLQVRLDPFTHPSCPTADTFNVVAWLPGRRNPERLVVVGGHYDSRTIDVFDAASPAPGANDSGSQTSLVLEAARTLAHQDYDATLVFIAFSGEEQGLFGSGSIAASLDKYFPGFKLVAMLNSDIVGGDNTVNGPAELQQFRLYSPGTPRERRTAAPDGHTDNTSPARGVMRYVGAWGGAYVPSMKMIPKLREDRPGRGSDHTSFLNKAFPAVRFMETVECSPSPVDNSGKPRPQASNPSCLDFNTSHQHSPFDLSTYVTAEYAARMTQLVASTAASLARAPSAPRNIKVTGDSFTGATISWATPGAGDVQHYVVAARSTRENLYRQRVRVPAEESSAQLSAEDLGLAPGESFFISVAAVDHKGHESLFAYPEYRCDTAGCAVPAGALDVVVFE